MGEQYLSKKTVINEIVGIVGTLNSRNGSTVKDIASVLESLHGPFSVRPSMIQNCLNSSVSSGVLVCKNRRYKVYKQNYGNARYRSTDSKTVDDSSSFSSDSVQSHYCLLNPEEGLSRSASESCTVDELWSNSCPDHLSICSSDLSNTGSLTHSKPKPRKRKAKRNLKVKLPMEKKIVAKERETVVEDVLCDEVNDCQQETKSLVNDTEENTCLGEVDDEDQFVNTSLNEIKNQELSQSDFEENISLDEVEDECVKKSMNHIMNQIMNQLSEHNKPNDDAIKDDKGIKRKEESEEEDKASYEHMAKIMTTVMERVNTIEHSDSVRALQTGSRDVKGDVTSVIEGITKMITRFTGGQVPQNATPDLLENNDIPMSDDVESQAIPGCSNHTTETIKGEKRTASQCKRNVTKKFKK